MLTNLLITMIIISILISLYFVARARIKNIPATILLKNGTEINRFVGVKSKEYLPEQIQKY